MSVTDWIGVALMAPFLLAMLTLAVYFTIGVLRSPARVRRVQLERRAASQQAAEPAEPAPAAAQPKRAAEPQQAPSD